MVSKIPPIGVLALQGDFEKHQEIFHALTTETVRVRVPEDLQKVSALVIPGGESTTLRILMKKSSLWEAIIGKREEHFPIFGTCAGVILLSKEIPDSPGEETLGFLNIQVLRNAYGRQRESFITPVQFLPDGASPVSGVFIRAPQIIRVGKDVQVLARFQNSPVLVEEGFCLGATFHPELVGEVRIHQRFLNLVHKRWA